MFLNVKIEKFVGGNLSYFRCHVGWWNLITSVRLIQVGNNKNDHFRYFLGVHICLNGGVCLIKVLLKVQ